MGVSTKSKTIKKTKKKVLKDRVKASVSQNGQLPSTNELSTHSKTPSNNCSIEDKADESSTPPPSSDDILNRLYTPDQLAEIRQRIKNKQKEARETPKLLFQIERLKTDVKSSKLLTAESFVDDEHLKSVFVESATGSAQSISSSGDGEPFLFSFDVQELLLRGLLGGRYVPRWCNLLRFKFISKLALVVVDGVSEVEWNDHVDCLKNLQCMMAELPAKLFPPEVQGTSLLDELFAIPFSLSEAKVLDHFYNFKFNGGNNHTLKDRRADRFLEAIESIKKNRRVAKGGGAAAVAAVESNGDSENDDEERVSPQQLSERLPVQDVAGRKLMAQDGVLTWVDLQRHADVTPRRDLLMTEAEMAREKFPLPYTLDPEFASEFGHTSDSYTAPTRNSPMFAIDCEMCLTTRGILELTHVAVVDEHLRCVLQAFLKPAAKIVNYLTQFSGVTAKSLEGEGILTVEDVQRKIREILPSDAILVGHSLNGDLTAMRLIHPYVIDTSVIFNLRGIPGLKSKLRDLAFILLGRKIQEFNKTRVGHDALEDARATMELVLLRLRNGAGFGDLTAPQNAGRFGLESFVSWYDEVGESQRKARFEGGWVEEGKEKAMEVDSGIINGEKGGNANEIDKSNENDGDGAISTNSLLSSQSNSMRVPLRDAFLKRSASSRMKTFRNVFDQLRIQRERNAIAVDHEDLLEKQLKNLRKNHPSSTKCEPTDKLIVKSALRAIPDNYFVSLQLHRYRSLINADTERRREALTKIDKRLKKVYDALPKKAMMVIVFSGRKRTEEAEDGGSLDEFHYGLVFGGVKTR